MTALPDGVMWPQDLDAHQWVLDESGNPDTWGYEAEDEHSGFRCALCGFTMCYLCRLGEEPEEKPLQPCPKLIDGSYVVLDGSQKKLLPSPLV